MSESGQYLRIAKIAGTHGVNGRLKLVIITDLIKRFTPGNRVYLNINNEYKPYIINDFLNAAKSPLLKLEEINDRDTALSLKGAEIYITKSQAEDTRDILDSNDYYYYDLIGCQVYRDSNLFGNVTDIIEAGGNRILVIQKDGKKFLIPFIKTMVNTDNISKGRIDINPIDGLFD